MKYNTKTLTILISLFFFSYSLQAQLRTQDGRMWAGPGIKYKLDDHWDASCNVILRFKDDIGSYRDYFIEPGIGYKINAKVGFKASYRATIIPEVQDLQWVFLDFNANQKLGDTPFKISSRLRYHHGFDINEVVDPDFLRERVAISYQLNKFNLFMGVGAFFRLNKINEIQVMRYEVGTQWKVAPNWTLTAYYRRQDNVRETPFIFDGRFDLPVLGLVYTIPTKK